MCRASPARGGQIAQRPQTAFSDDVLGGLRNRSKHARDPAGFVANGAIGKGEIAFLRISVAIEQQQEVVRPGGFATLEHPFEHRPDDVPYLRPAFAAWSAQRRGMLARDNVAVGIVVEHNQVPAPPDHEWRNANSGTC